MKLAQLKEEFQKYFVIKDRFALEIVFATLFGNSLIERDPVWTMIIAPSSGGKTTLIAPCSGVNSVFFVDDLTEKTLLSGYKVKGKEASLLKLIGSGVMAFSDFTSILTKNPMSRGEILTQLKLVYDRKITKYTGTGGISWEGKIGFLGAATPDVYGYLESGRSMGERFLYYWLDQPTNEEIQAKQQTVKISSKEIGGIMAESYRAYYAGVNDWVDRNGVPDLKLSRTQRWSVSMAAIFCVNGKATIHTNFKTGKPDAIPNISGVGRDNKIFDTLLQTLQLMNCYEHNDPKLPVQDWMVEMVEKCAYSSINRERRKILEILSEGMSLTTTEIGSKPGLGLEREATELYLTPLHAVGMIRKKVAGTARWFMDDVDTAAFVKRASSMIVDTTHVEGIELPTKEDSDPNDWGEFNNHEK